MEKLEQFVIEKFTGIIFTFAVSWLVLVAYGLFNS